LTAGKVGTREEGKGGGHKDKGGRGRGNHERQKNNQTLSVGTVKRERRNGTAGRLRRAEGGKGGGGGKKGSWRGIGRRGGERRQSVWGMEENEEAKYSYDPTNRDEDGGMYLGSTADKQSEKANGG